MLRTIIRWFSALPIALLILPASSAPVALCTGAPRDRITGPNPESRPEAAKELEAFFQAQVHAGRYAAQPGLVQPLSLRRPETGSVRAAYPARPGYGKKIS